MAKPGDELSTKLREHVLEALNHFKEANGSYPERVLLFRDSVMNGTLNSNSVLHETEVAKLEEACASLGIKCLYCIVSHKS